MLDLTNNKRDFYPAIFSKSSELICLSKKQKCFVSVFAQMDFLQIGRIDAFELIAFSAWAVEGSFEKAIELIFSLFSFNKKAFLGKNEFFYFVDALFRATAKLYLVNLQSDKAAPARNWRVNSRDLSDFVNLIFGSETQLNKPDFISSFLENKSLFSEFLLKAKKQWNEEFKMLRKKIKALKNA